MIESILWVLFVLACLVVSFVILIQEGKGGGLGEAFGGAGQQAFGVKAEGINTFTGWASLAVVVLAITITLLRAGDSTMTFADGVPSESSSESVAAPAGATGGDAGSGDAAGTTGTSGETPTGGGQ
ncbi:MAG: preprotein translocase subunit SecG [Planctomycetota bacterium]